MKALIYHTKGCQKCRLTKALLGSTEVEMKLVDPSNKDLLNKFRDKGIKSFPVCEIIKDGLIIDEWNDFKPDKIDLYKNLN